MKELFNLLSSVYSDAAKLYLIKYIEGMNIMMLTVNQISI